MKLEGALVLAALVLAGCGDGEQAGAAHDPPPVSTARGTGPAALVNPLIGTSDSSAPNPVPGGAGGSTFPGAALPFGRVQWSPDTPNASPQGYLYDDHAILGFAMTHLSGAGCSGERDFPFFPSIGPPDPAGPSDGFSHDDEIAAPGFYRVKLASGIEVDLTATARTGFARFVFPSSAGGYVSIASGEQNDTLVTREFDAKVAGPGLVTGYRTTGFFCGSSKSYRIYFAARFDRAFSEHGTWLDDELAPGSDEATGARSGIYVRFAGGSRKSVQVKVGLSYVSTDGALAALDAESPGWDFDALHQKAVEAWNGWLGRVEVEGGTDDEQTELYTALYHVLLEPVVFDDVDGSYLGFDGQLHHSDGFVRYATFSGWDIYRSWIQLVSMLAPKEASDMVRSLVDAAGECGALPKWPLANDETGEMVGDPATPLIASAYAFGARDFDSKAALGAMLKDATDPSAACNGVRVRPGLVDYLARHYLPVDGSDGFVWGPPSTTLEYAIADFALSRFAQALGDTTNAEAFLARGRYWQNVFDPDYGNGTFMGYMQPRLYADAGGKPAFQTVAITDKDAFVEGNAAQYTFFVPHDLGGLASALGGDAMMITRLDDLSSKLNAGLTQPYFYIGNEPEFATPWEYPFVGAPAKTQEVVRRVIREEFSNSPGGLPGNDDLGATSSWLVFAMLGFYPVMPGEAQLVLASPLFSKITLSLESGKSIVITASGAGSDAPYVQSLSVNGSPTTKTWLDWQSLSGGATLDFALGTTPSPSWGTAPADRPPMAYP